MLQNHTHNAQIAIADDGENASAAASLSSDTGLGVRPFAACNDLDFILFWRDETLTLSDNRARVPTSICVDFKAGRSRHRRLYGGGAGQPLARAVNIKNREATVCDATAGLGQDSFVIASLGATVILLEKSPVVFALLRDGLRRARQDPEISAIAQRMRLFNLDSSTLPATWPTAERPTTVYLDPMYPHSRKSAASRKGMSTLQRLLVTETREDSLLKAAIATATQRVAVKRPAKAIPLAGIEPVGCIRSPNTRYDLYKGAG